MKLLALDIGLKRIGVAISDGTVVGSLDTLEVVSRQDAILKILEICRTENVDKIILGLPLNQSGQSDSADLVRSFAQELNKMIALPLEFEDETLTSSEAERILKHSNLDPTSTIYKKEVDRLSAKMILEQYLKGKN